MKPAFEERMKQLMPDPADFASFCKIVHTSPQSYIRCNTLKMDPDVLFARLNLRWKVVRPFPKHEEIMRVDSELGPGELGKALEHLLGYYYIQEVSSMLSVIALDVQAGDLVVDVCASPGSKTTQMGAAMKNKGTIIANDIKLDRITILAANLERCGVSNQVMTRLDGVGLCDRLAQEGFLADRILLDAPCSGEGTLRSSPKTFVMWNPKVVVNLGRMQKKLIAHAIRCLRKDGILVYSTCTHAPEENEAVVDFALKNFPVELVEFELPLKTRPGVTEWKGEEFNKEVKKCHRLYPQDNDSEGFFVAKLKLVGDIER